MPAVHVDRVIALARSATTVALVAATVHVVKGRHYNEEGARREMEQVIAELRKAVGLEAEAR
jgi:hypothetical protein